MSNNIINSIDAERKRLTTQLRALDKARALLQPEEEVPVIKRASPRRKPKAKRRVPTRKGKSLSQPDRGLAKTIVTALGQIVPRAGYMGMTAVEIVELLQGRGFIFTSKFPSRSVSGLLTILHRVGRVDRTPVGKPRIYHYRAASAPAVIPEVPITAPGEGGPGGLEARG